MHELCAKATLADLFLLTSERFAHRGAVRFRRDGRWTEYSFRELRERVFASFHALRYIGLAKGDHIAILSENRPEWFIADLAIQCLGCASVPLYATLKTDQIQYIIQQSEAKLIFVENREQLGKIRHCLNELPNLKKLVVLDPFGVELDEKVISFQEFHYLGKELLKKGESDVLESVQSIQPEDLASLVYTSGTTGHPKGVMLTHLNFMSDIMSLKRVFELSEEDIILGILPLSHVLERCGAYYTAFLASGSMYVFTESLETVARDMTEVKPTFIVAVPRLFEKIYLRIIDSVKSGSGVKKALFNWALQVGRAYYLEHRASPPGFVLQQQFRLANQLVFSKLHQRFGGRIRYFVSGGASLEPRIAQFFASVGIKIMEGYGLTETSPVNTVNHDKAVRLGSVGKPIDCVQIKLAEDGEILIKGPNVTRGYYRKPEETQELFDDEGWLKTGDIGRIDEDGFLWIIDRKKEIIVTSGGKNIAPQPIESMLTSNPFISHAMLVGDHRNFIAALIVPDFETLSNWCRKNGLGDLDMEQMIKHEDVYNKIQSEIQETIAGLPRYEQAKKFILLSNPWTIEGGELTPTMKLKRRVILRKFSSHIESLYRPDIRQR
ncbi:long-chain fatty acid--CoA ligase [bacterium]|nr:long-chain fatty acid--CoA ligase [candidate division CSSED10-310 bacterium]